MRDLFTLPPDLPVPQDDGACAHLTGMALPDLALASTFGHQVNLRLQARKPTIIFIYPRTGEPAKPAPAEWDLIPGARGCTPQSCGFRDLHADFKKLGLEVFGLSTQSTEYQQEFVERNHIPFEILSDENFAFTEAMPLPTFTYHGMRLLKRMALVLGGGEIEKVFYPVFPPNENAATVLTWLSARGKLSSRA